MSPCLFPSRGLVVPVKVCGITRLQDALLAYDLGASALGFIFHPASPRFITPGLARLIRRELPPDVLCVGVFVNRSAEDMNAIAAEVGLDMLQLHGREDGETLRRCERPVIKAVRGEDEGTLDTHPADLLLVDAERPGQPGGTGQRADWAFAARIARRRPLLLAGGLGPENLQEALATVAPAAVDVNSGVECAPGLKDAQRLQNLFQLLQTQECLP